MYLCSKFVAKEVAMSIITLQVPASEIGWIEQMIRARGWKFSVENSPVAGQPQAVTPALRRKINAARKEYAEGKTIACKTPQEMQRFFDAL